MKSIIFIIAVFVIIPKMIFSSPYIDIEGGRVFSTYNDVQIPGDSGTRFSLSEDLKEERAYYYRLRTGFIYKRLHNISLLYAPLEIKSSGQVNRDIDFAGMVFAANSNLKARYVFNSYRLTYRYEFYSGKSLIAGAGLTGKVREAEISLRDNTKEAKKDNVGFVPLINFSILWNFVYNISFLIQGDALFSTMGRAEDVMTAVQYHVNKKVIIRAGYRILEGGADNDDVYTFALFNYFFAGFSIYF